MTTSESTRSSTDRGIGGPFATVELFGLPFVDAANEAIVADHLARWSLPAKPDSEAHDRATGTLPLVVTPNVDIVVQLQGPESEAMVSAIKRAAYVLPDGWPIVKVSSLRGCPLQSRIAGSSVFAHWWPQIVADERRVAMLLSGESVQKGLEAEHPQALCLVPPMIAPTPEAIGSVADDFVDRAVELDAEFLFFGIGHPKDPALALAVFERWPSDRPLPLAFCLGASAELYLGLRRRAPEWSQRMGLEWMVRFAQEPRRMFHRYFVRDLAFFPLAFREIRGRGRS